MAHSTFSDFRLPLRLFLVFFISVLLAVPIAFVWLVVELRSDYEQQVSAEISQGWGNEQILIGPFLHMQVRVPIAEAPVSLTHESLLQSYFFTPQSLTATSTSEHQIRQLGIFAKPVYVANIQLSGTFSPDLRKYAERRHLEAARIESCSMILAVSSTRTIRSISAKFDDRELEIEPSPQRLGWFGEPIQALLAPEECGVGEFSFDLVARGSNQHEIALVGDETRLTMAATWPHPKFEGRQLPDNHNITETGFSAEWTSNALARGFASTLDQDEWLAIDRENVVGFSYHESVTLYRMVTRAVKYGFFVVGLTLLSIFCIELISQTTIHPVQYAIVGGALALFYLLLLSFSEHIGFVASYVLASSLLAILIVGYAWFSTRKLKFSGTIAGLIVGIYTALYLCLSSTDYALLIGSILLVVLLTGLMYATRGLIYDDIGRRQ